MKLLELLHECIIIYLLVTHEIFEKFLSCCTEHEHKIWKYFLQYILNSYSLIMVCNFFTYYVQST
jgi:hypothetical protein